MGEARRGERAVVATAQTVKMSLCGSRGSCGAGLLPEAISLGLAPVITAAAAATAARLAYRLRVARRAVSGGPSCAAHLAYRLRVLLPSGRAEESGSQTADSKNKSLGAALARGVPLPRQRRTPTGAVAPVGRTRAG